MSSVALPIPCVQGDKGTVNVGVGATFLAISIVLTGLRIFTRTRRVTAGLGWDDATIIIAVVSNYLQEIPQHKVNQASSYLRFRSLLLLPNMYNMAWVDISVVCL